MNTSDVIHAEHLTEGDAGPFLPVCFCLDTSDSMHSSAGGGLSRLQCLQNGIDSLYSRIGAHEYASAIVNLSIVTFDEEARILQGFTRAGQVVPPRLTLGGNGTAMGAGVNLALDLLRSYSEEFQRKHYSFSAPWLIIMSDGRNNIGRASFQRAQARIREQTEQRRLNVFPFGIGASADLDQLNALSPRQEAFRLGENQMDGMFDWFILQTALISTGVIDGNTGTKLEKYVVESWTTPLAEKRPV